MRTRTLEQIMTEEAITKANWIFKDGHTVGLTCDNMRRRLMRADRDHNSGYFNQGRACYFTFTQALQKRVDYLFAAHGMKYHYTIPAWDDPINLNL